MEISVFTDASVFIGGFGSHGSSIDLLMFIIRYEVSDFQGFSNNIFNLFCKMEAAI